MRSLITQSRNNSFLVITCFVDVISVVAKFVMFRRRSILRKLAPGKVFLNYAYKVILNNAYLKTGIKF